MTAACASLAPPSADPIEQSRRFFADELRMIAGLRTPAVWDAFATVPRERFFGPGPWRFAISGFGAGSTYATTEDDNPSWLYHNVSLAIDESRHLVSAEPRLVARSIEDLNIQRGQRVLHIGSGVGYYTAVLAELTGPGGAVLATESDRELARRSRENLEPYPWVTVHQGPDLPEGSRPFDVILVNAGVTHLQPAWLDRLSDGGRLLVPMTTAVGATQGVGFVLLVARTGEVFSVALTAPTLAYSAVGLRETHLEPIVAQAVATGVIRSASVVRRDPHTPQRTCVVHYAGACLSLRG